MYISTHKMKYLDVILTKYVRDLDEENYKCLMNCVRKTEVCSDEKYHLCHLLHTHKTVLTIKYLIN